MSIWMLTGSSTRARQAVDNVIDYVMEGYMAVLHAPRLWGAKPISGKSTASALIAGDQVFAKTGVTPDLKRILKMSLDNDRRTGRLKP